MKKQEAENLLKITIYALKKWGYLKGEKKSGFIMWTRGDSKQKNSVQIEALTLVGEPHIQISYVTKKEKKSARRKHLIPLVTSNCYFGGKRYWFQCFCKKRVGVLYGNGDTFLCRHCHNLSYESKNRNTRSPFYEVGKSLRIKEVIIKLSKDMRRPLYSGKPTKKLREIEILRIQLQQQSRIIYDLFKDVL